MSIDAGRSRLTVEELAARFRGEMIPLTSKFSYFSTLPMAEEDLRQYLNDPIAAISPAIISSLPKMGIFLAPYLEKGNGKEGDCVTFERPIESRQIACSIRDLKDLTILALSIKDMEVADYHYQFYNALASVVANRWPVRHPGALFPHHSRGAERRDPRRSRREELAPQAGAPPPTDQRPQGNQAVPGVRPAGLRGYPDPLPSRHLLRHRRRDGAPPDAEPLPAAPARMLVSLYPPPEGYAVLPEQLKTR